MKILKRIVLLLVVVIAAGIIYVLVQPSNYDVSRSKTIDAPAAIAFNVVNEMRTWEKWGPWNEDDPTIEVTYGEITSGVGAYNSWISKDGPGNMKTVNVVANELIEQKMQFEDFEPSDVIWKFKEVDGKTQITWQMKEDNAPFGFKIASAIMGGYDNMLGSMQEKGLDNLEKVIMEEVNIANSFRMDEVTSVDLEKKKFIGFFQKTTTDLTHEDMTKLFMETMPKVGAYAAQNGLAFGDYTPGSVYTKWDEENKEAEFYIGLLLNKDLKPGEGMDEIIVPAGKGVMVRKYGQYGTGDMEAHAAIAKYMEANKAEAQGLVWELYTNDPVDVKPQDIQTDIYYLLK